jgi:hypothetical protein
LILGDNIDKKTTFLIPELAEKDLVDNFPVSPSFLLQCFARALHRTPEQHLLEYNDPVRLILVQMMYIRMLQGHKFDDAFLKVHNLDDFITVPMTDESLNEEIPDDLRKIFMQVLVDPHSSNSTATISELVKALIKHKSVLARNLDVRDCAKLFIKEI